MFGNLRYNIGTARNSNGPVPFACIKRKQGNFKPEVPFQNNTGLPWTASQKGDLKPRMPIKLISVQSICSSPFSWHGSHDHRGGSISHKPQGWDTETGALTSQLFRGTQNNFPALPNKGTACKRFTRWKSISAYYYGVNQPFSEQFYSHGMLWETSCQSWSSLNEI